ncbi:MAG: phosphatidylserine decarboxylase [Rickettsiales bacterium]
MHKEGYLFIGIFLFVTLLLFFFSKPLGVIGVILTIWCVCFFRDPERVTPVNDLLVVSPADGTVVSISQNTAPTELELGDEKFTKVSIFLSVFDVHVNRIPIAGKVTALHYHPGKFFNASLDKASEFNERQSILVEHTSGAHVPVVQIAGLIARRIVCNLEENQVVTAGERFGIIRFGSRVDIYLPKGIEPKVLIGQYMIGGETVIAELKNEKKTKSKG